MPSFMSFFGSSILMAILHIFTSDVALRRFDDFLGLWLMCLLWTIIGLYHHLAFPCGLNKIICESAEGVGTVLAQMTLDNVRKACNTVLLPNSPGFHWMASRVSSHVGLTLMQHF